MQYKRSLAIMSAIILIPAMTYATPTKHIVIAPTCLINNTTAHFNALAVKNGMQLLAIENAGIRQLNAAKHRSKTACGGFMDVSSEWNQTTTRTTQDPASFLAAQLGSSPQPVTTPGYKIQYQAQTEAMLKTINPQNMWDNLTVLSNFEDRDAHSNTGLEAAQWIKAKIESIATETGHEDVTVYLVKTPGYSQPSVVAKFGNTETAGIVIGGHLDGVSCQSTVCTDDSNTIFPAADDNGSGSVTVMETARTLLASGMKFKKPIYFIWYAAEEEGLIGSKYVVADFKKKKIPVDAVMQLDMTGYAYQNQQTMWLMTDFVSNELNTYLKTLIKTYVKKPVKTSQCGYACSDHASWNKAGFKATFPFETEMGHDNPENHTPEDKMDLLSLEHMTDFAKLATSFAVELAEPVQ